MLNVEICYICGKKLSADPKNFGERIAGSIKPRGLRTRYFCASCWNEEMMSSKTDEKGKHNGCIQG